MLSLGKLRGGRETADYYLGMRREAEVSQAAYYTGCEQLAEPPGQWFGSGLEAAGVEAGRIDDEAFAELLEGHVVPSGEQLGRAPRRGDGVAAYDFTFSAPKSVSLLVAYGDQHVAEAARQAHGAACVTAVGWLEVEACGVRLAHGEQVESEDGEVRWKTRYQRADGAGFIGASFEQFTSRTLDPQLHTHHVALNKTMGPDGKWRTLDGQRLYASAKAAGTVYQAELRRQLTRRLSVSWGPVENGLADIKGVDRELIEHFSTRRQQVEARLQELASGTARAAQEAALQTRPVKGHPDHEAVQARWDELEASAPQPVREVVADCVDLQEPARTVALGELDADAVHRAVSRRLAEGSPTFARSDVVAAIADVLPPAVEDRDGLLRAAEEWLSWAREQGELVPLLSPDAEVQVPVGLTGTEVDRLVDRGWMVQEVGADGSAGQIRRLRWLPGQQRYTTRTLLGLEQQALAAAGEAAGRPLVDTEALRAAKAGTPTLLDAQAAMLEALAGSDRRLTAVVGPGGSGKTFAIGVAAEAWQAEGRAVVGTAVSGAAADELGASAGIKAETIAQLRVDVDRHGHGETFPAGVVLVVDEASMVETHDLAWLVEQVQRARGQLVLVGDPAQLPSVGPGGVFHRLAERGEVIQDLLGVNARQELALDREALAELRAGKVAAAVGRYRAAGRLHVADTPVDAMAAMVSDWFGDVLESGLEEPRMLAVRRQDVATLNELARARVAAAGGLAGPTVAVGGRRYQRGDRVVATRNDRRYAGLRNSHTGTVVQIEESSGAIIMRRDRDEQLIRLPKAYARRHLDWAYATTAHKAQGATYEANTRVYVDLQGATQREHGYVGLSRAVQESHLYLAEDQMRTHIAPGVYVEDRRDPLQRLVEQLEASAVQPLAADSGRPVASQQTSALLTRREELATRLQTIPPGVSDRLAEAEQTLQRARSQAARPGAPRGARDRLARLERAYAELATKAEERRRWLEDHGHLIGEYQDIAGELAARRTRRVISLPFDQKAQELLGPAPSRDADEAEVAAWRRAAHEYVAVEQRYGDVELAHRETTQRLRVLVQDLDRARQMEYDLGPSLSR